MDILTEENFERRTATWTDLWFLVARRWKVVAAAFLATVLCTYLGLQMMTDRYDSSASLLVKVGRENAEVPATVQNGGLMPAGVKPEEIKSEIEMITSQALMEKVVDEIGVGEFLAQPPRPVSVLLWPKYYAKQAVRWLKKQEDAALVALNLKRKLTDREAVVLNAHDNLVADSEKGSNVISLHLRFPNPQLGQRVVQVLIQEYLNQHTAVHRNPAVRDFFAQALERNRQRLLELEAQREQVRQKWNLSSVPDQQALLLKQRNDIQSQMDAAQSEAAMLRKEQQTMQQRMAQLPAEVPSSTVQTENPSIQSIRDRITTLQLEHAKLASRYQPGTGPLSKNEEELAELQRQLASEPATVQGRIISEANPVRRDFAGAMEQNDVKVLGLQAKNAAMTSSAQAIDRQLRGLNHGQDALEDVERQIKTADDNYATYAKHFEEARISEELDLRRIANIAILSPPATGYEPVYPRKLLIMGLSLPLGLLVGILFVLLLGYMDDTIHSERDLAELETMYLGRMPAVKG